MGFYSELKELGKDVRKIIFWIFVVAIFLLAFIIALILPFGEISDEAEVTLDQHINAYFNNILPVLLVLFAVVEFFIVLKLAKTTGKQIALFLGLYVVSIIYLLIVGWVAHFINLFLGLLGALFSVHG